MTHTGDVIKGKLESYILLANLQECLYGHVVMGVGIITGDAVAIKCLNIEELKMKRIERDPCPETPLAEVFFAQLLRSNEHVATIREVIGTEQYHYLVSDLANGEDVLELLKHYPYGLPEETVSLIMSRAGQGLLECHEQRVALQDFSLENCLIYLEMSGEIRIKLCDPGQGVVFKEDSNGEECKVKWSGYIGKKFRPPEIFKEADYYATKIDSWCFGWSLFYLLYGAEVFESVQDPSYEVFLQGDMDSLAKVLNINKRIKSEPLELLRELLHPDPLKRCSIKRALSHPFFSRQAGQVLRQCHLPAVSEPTLSLVVPRELGTAHGAGASVIRMAVHTLSLVPPEQRPTLLKALSMQMPCLRIIDDKNHSKTLNEISQRARTIRRLLAEAGPQIPRSYFIHHLHYFCQPHKPSHTLVEMDVAAPASSFKGTARLPISFSTTFGKTAVQLSRPGVSPRAFSRHPAASISSASSQAAERSSYERNCLPSPRPTAFRQQAHTLASIPIPTRSCVEPLPLVRAPSAKSTVFELFPRSTSAISEYSTHTCSSSFNPITLKSPVTYSQTLYSTPARFVKTHYTSSHHPNDNKVMNKSSNEIQSNTQLNTQSNSLKASTQFTAKGFIKSSPLVPKSAGAKTYVVRGSKTDKPTSFKETWTVSRKEGHSSPSPDPHWELRKSFEQCLLTALPVSGLSS